MNKYLINQRFFSWFLFILGALFYGYEYGLRIMPSLVMPEIMSHFYINHAGFGYIAAAYYYAYVLFQVPVGILMDRFGAIRLLMIACLTCTLGQLIFANTDYFFIAIIARFIIGAGSVFAFVGALSIASAFFPSRYFALLAGLTSAFGTLSAMASDILLTKTLDAIGWMSTNNLLILTGGLLAFALYCSNKKVQDTDTEREKVTLISLLRNSVEFLRDRRFWLNALIGCLIYFPTTLFAELWGIPYLRIARGFTETQAALGISFLFFGYTLGAPFAGILSERFNRLNLLIFSGSLACLLSLVVLYLPSLRFDLLVLLLFALGFSYGSQALIFAIAKDLVSSHSSGSVLAFTNMIVMLGGVLFQPIVGHLIDFIQSHSHNQDVLLYSYQCALFIMPFGIFISVVLSCLQKRFF